MCIGVFACFKDVRGFLVICSSNSSVVVCGFASFSESSEQSSLSSPKKKASAGSVLAQRCLVTFKTPVLKQSSDGITLFSLFS